MDKGRLEKYYTAIGDEDPVPIVHYKQPGTVARVDEDSDFMKTLILIPSNTLTLTRKSKSFPF